MKRTLATNIPLYFLYTALKAFGFGLFTSVWVIYLQQQRGLSLSQAALIDVTFFVAAAVAELPTGVVADRYGRKMSLTIGVAMMSAGLFGWIFAPTLPLIIAAYVIMGVGITFLSGADEAFFYETVRASGRGDDYARLLGRASATFPGALALGSVVGGFLVAVALPLPFILAGVMLLLSLVVVLLFVEPPTENASPEQPAASFADMLRQALTAVRAQPTLRNAMLYLAVVPLASFMIESVFVQPQAVALGLPLVALGVLAMIAQLTAMFGSVWSERITARLGAGRVLTAAPALIGISLLLLAALQVLPALVLIVVMGFAAAVVRPILMKRIQDQVPDSVRATMLSVQSLTFTVVAAISQPTLGVVADRWGLPMVYVVLAGVLSGVMVVLVWNSRRNSAQMRTAAETLCAAVE